MCRATSGAHDRCMDNSYLYFSTAEIDYRRERMMQGIKPRRRRGARSTWRRRHDSELAT